jgi:hypothetical protein
MLYTYNYIILNINETNNVYILKQNKIKNNKVNINYFLFLKII